MSGEMFQVIAGEIGELCSLLIDSTAVGVLFRRSNLQRN